MDDKLYYVEGPQGEVLGPMNMIQVLEGIAAGAVLESARICGVGEQEWINLADVAYTREDLPEAAVADEPLAPAPMPFEASGDPAPAQDAIPSGLPASALPYDSVPDGSDDFVLHMPEEPAYVPQEHAPQEHAVPVGAGVAPDHGAGDGEFGIDAAEPAPKRGRVTWVIPVVAGLGVPALFGIYLLASGTFSKSDEPSGDETVAVAPVPDMPPVQAGQGAGEGWVDWDGLHGEENATESGMTAQPGTTPDAGDTREPVSLQLKSPPESGMELTKPEVEKVDPVEAARLERQRREESEAADRVAEAAAERYQEQDPAPSVNVAPTPSAPAPSEPPAGSKLTSLGTIKVTAPPAEDHTAIREQVTAVRSALAGKEFERARRVLDKARLEAAGDATAIANLDLWGAITEFEQGNLPDALARFEKLDRDASYEPSGFGAGAVANWIAWLHLSSGDVRSAVGVLDEVGPADADQYAQARLWEGMALASLGMNELAERTWQRLPAEAGSRVTGSGAVAVHTAEFLTGAISEKEYRTSIGTDPHWTNDMHYFLGYAARRASDGELAREHFRRAMDVSQGKEFPYHLAEAEIAGEGMTK